jgi:tetratricopeptide (TPR) repeat protein
MDPRKSILLIGVFLLGCIYLGCKPAQPSVEIAITTTSDEARQLFLQARDRLENSEIGKAAALFDQAIQKDPGFALAYAMRSQSGGGSVVARENREKAMALIGKVSKGEQLLIHYIDAQAGGQTALVKQYLDSLLLSFPRDKRIQLLAGLYYRGLADYKKSVMYYEQAARLDSNYAPPYNLLGYDNMSLGNADAAEKAFKSYIRLLPSSPNPRDSYAEFLRMTGRYDESIEQYKKVLEMDPLFTSSMVGIGDCYVRKGDPKKAREYYQTFIDKSPQINDKLSGYYSLATSYVLEGIFPEAIKALDGRKELALKENQNVSAVWAVGYQGYLLSSLGKPQDGLKKYDEAVQLTRTLTLPDRARENLLFWSNFWLSYAYLESKNIAKAKECIAAFGKDVDRRRNPGEDNALKTAHGYLDIKEGRFDEGIQKLSSVPEEPFTIYALALAYAKKGDRQNAGIMMDKLKKWGTVSLDWAICLKQVSMVRGK